MISCKLRCDYTCATLDAMYMHFKRRHPTGGWNRQEYKEPNENIYGGVKPDTYRKRRRTLARKDVSICSEVSVVVPDLKQCSYVHLKKGTRCKQMCVTTTRTTRCFTHKIKRARYAHTQTYTMPEDGVVLKHITIRQSEILGAGRGVFTTDMGNFEAGDFITEYSGTIYSLRDFEAIGAPEEYTFRMPRNRYLVGLSDPLVGSGLGSFLNRGSPATNNCEFHVSGDVAYIKATKRIGPDTELLISYGSGYKIKKRRRSK